MADDRRDVWKWVATILGTVVIAVGTFYVKQLSREMSELRASVTALTSAVTTTRETLAFFDITPEEIQRIMRERRGEREGH